MHNRLIHRSAWKWNSANFAISDSPKFECEALSEVSLLHLQNPGELVYRETGVSDKGSKEPPLQLFVTWYRQRLASLALHADVGAALPDGFVTQPLKGSDCFIARDARESGHSEGQTATRIVH